jgi:hypothetical protein
LYHPPLTVSFSAKPMSTPDIEPRATFFFAFLGVVLAAATLEYSAPAIDFGWQKWNRKPESSYHNFAPMGVRPGEVSSGGVRYGSGQLIEQTDGRGMPTSLKIDLFDDEPPRFNFKPMLRIEQRVPVWLALIVLASIWSRQTRTSPTFRSKTVYCVGLPLVLAACTILSIVFLRPAWVDAFWQFL